MWQRTWVAIPVTKIRMSGKSHLGGRDDRSSGHHWAWSDRKIQVDVFRREVKMISKYRLELVPWPMEIHLRRGMLPFSLVLSTFLPGSTNCAVCGARWRWGMRHLALLLTQGGKTVKMQSPFYSLAIRHLVMCPGYFQNMNSGRPVLHTVSQPLPWLLRCVSFFRGLYAWVPTSAGREHL